MQKQKQGYAWRYAAFMMAYYVTNAVYQGYISKYYVSVGISNVRLSVLMAATPAIAIFMQPVWGMLGDRMKSRTFILRIMIVLSTVMILLFGVSHDFLWLLPVTILFAAAYTAIQPMGDSIVLECLLKEDKPFGPIRLSGCWAFAVMNVVFGYVLEGRFNFVLYLTAGMLMVLLLSTFCLPHVAGHQSSGQKMNISALFKRRELMLLLAMMMLLQLTLGYFYSFYSVHFTMLPGGSMGLLGISYFISAVSETPFLLNADKLFEKLGVGKLLCIAAAALTARWVILASTTNVYVVMASQVLHGWGFIVMTVSMAKYINITVPDELKASGQMLLAVVGFGIARVFGILGGGLLSEALGSIQNCFWAMAGVSGVALVLFAPYYFRHHPLNGTIPNR